MKLNIYIVAFACAASVCMPVTAANNGGSTPQKFVGIYSGTATVDSIALGFGTFSCVEFQQFVPDFVCEGPVVWQLNGDGSVVYSFSGRTLFGQWRATGSRTVIVDQLDVEEAQGNTPVWAVRHREFNFANDYDSFSSAGAVKRYPINEDPANPVSPSQLTIEFSGTAERFK